METLGFYLYQAFERIPNNHHAIDRGRTVYKKRVTMSSGAKGDSADGQKSMLDYVENNAVKIQLPIVNLDISGIGMGDQGLQVLINRIE